MPVEPAIRPIALHAAAQRRDAAVIIGRSDPCVDQIGPLERRLRVMHEQRGLPGGVGIAARERIIIGTEGAQRGKPGSPECLIGAHAQPPK